MKYAAPLLLSAVIALLNGCSSMKVTSEELTDFDFGSVAAYEWIQAPKKILDEDDTYLNENVQKALNNALSERGWKQTLKSDEADIQVVYYIKLVEQEEYAGGSLANDEHAVQGGISYSKESNSWGAKSMEPDLSVYTVEIGTLILQVYDTESGKQVWTGSLKTRLDRSTPLEKQPQLLRKIARKITGRIPGK